MFNCEQCGSCCKAVKCNLLIKENICSIYNKRPDICRVDIQYNKVKMTMSLVSWYKLNKKCCLILQSKNIFLRK